jgi:outer membrane protein, heavy metal efflux system
MKNYINIIYWLFLFFPFCIQAQTIDDYLKEAALNNPGLKSSYTDFEAALQRVSQESALPDPVISFGYFIDSIETKVGPQKAKISLNQKIPWFGTLEAKKDAASLLAQAKHKEFVNVKNNLYYKVKKTYYSIYEFNEHIHWQEENLKILTSYKNLSLSAFSNTKGSMLDVIRVGIIIENIETDILLLKDKLKPLQVAFNNLLNKPVDSLIELPEELSFFDIEDNYRKDRLLNQNPLLQEVDLKIKAASANEKIANKKGLPQFSIGVDYAFIDDISDSNIADNGKNALMPMLSLTLPIFRGKHKASVKETKLIQNSLLAQKEELENNLVTSYEKSHYEMKESIHINYRCNEQENRIKQAINLLYVEYSNSGKEFEEILRMQQLSLKYSMEKITAVKKFYLALADLDYLTAKSLL